jgi:hypothetical protein
MKKVIRLTETDLVKMVRKIIRESDMYTLDDKYDEFQTQLNNYDTGFKNVYFPGIHKVEVRRGDDCDKNKVFVDPINGMVLITYCNYEGEKSVKELDTKGDEMWDELKHEALMKFEKHNDRVMSRY